jgi:predicted transcriptional regulator YheO
MKINTTLHPNITAQIPLLEGIIGLFYPYAEGAVHDLKRGKIIALYNNISKRKVGDPSAVTELGVDIKDFPDVFDPYYKTNWDGKQLKCVSTTIRDESGAPIGLICINFDTSIFQTMNIQLEKFLSLANKNSLNPVERFGTNWQQQVSAFVDEFARKHNVAINAMSKEQKAQLVGEMYDHALFNYRDAATYVARQLGVSRTTIYNYLKEWSK